jgi:hypothetical protein
VVQFTDKRVLKGKTNNFFPNKNGFHLELTTGEKTEIQVEALKAIFFVKSFDGNQHRQDSYGDKVPGGGRKIKVKFKDGEAIIGYTTGYSPDSSGFYMLPADLKGNNERIFIVKSATETIEML